MVFFTQKLSSRYNILCVVYCVKFQNTSSDFSCLLLLHIFFGGRGELMALSCNCFTSDIQDSAFLISRISPVISKLVAYLARCKLRWSHQQS